MIFTKRFFLRQLEVSDVSDDYFNWFNSDLNRRYIIYTKNEISIPVLKSYVADKINNPLILFLGIFDNITNTHIGNIKFEPIDIERKFSIMGVLIGNPLYKGIGVFPEVFLECTNYLKIEYGLQEIYLGVSKSNSAAIRAYLKAGFEEIGNSPYLKKESSESMVMRKII
jgi:ribosomal-protein-alanine N-acetyltransferase